jgi:large subunit ribosomal protein L35
MPKMKTNSSAKKRFSFTGTGKIKRKHAFKNHILTKKETKQKRNLGKFAIVSPSDEGRVKMLLAIGK